MSDERRIENIVELTETMWILNKRKVLKELAQSAKMDEIPEDCHRLVEAAFRFGATYMERTIGRR